MTAETNNNLQNKEGKAWVVTATMGYGHHRAVMPLKEIAEGNILLVGSNKAATQNEAKLWKRVLGIYEFISRAKGIPLIGNPIFNLLEAFLHIPSYYPMRDLSNSTFQVDMLRSSIGKGLCAGMLETVKSKNLPIVTSFYAPAIAADMYGWQNVYCVICDADLNRVWVAKEPWESRIEYFAPCGKAAQRLKAYGVPDERIFITGFPLPVELLGGKNLDLLKQNLGARLARLDPSGKFRSRHEKNVIHFLGPQNYNPAVKGKLTITYAVGGAGAQKEIGGQVAQSLKNRIFNNEVKLNLVAGTRPEVRNYFIDVKEGLKADSNKIEVIYGETIEEYFAAFNRALKDTDVLWTKPSELSFYTALGLPLIMTPPIGSQEKFNSKWLFEIQAGFKQEDPAYTDQWLFELLNKGRLADAAWSGFLKARKLGTYKIMEIVETGKMSRENSAVLR
jgi:hypothetical protein